MAELEHIPPPPPDGGGPESPLTALRARRKEIHAETTRDFDIPGYDGELVARYRVLPFEEVNQIERRNMLRSPAEEREINTYADELVAACVGMYVRHGGELVPAGPDPDRPVRYDQRLADGLELGKFETGRDVVFAVFELVFGEVRAHWALNDHHTAVFLWMRGNPADEDDDGARGDAEEKFRGE